MAVWRYGMGSRLRFAAGCRLVWPLGSRSPFTYHTPGKVQIGSRISWQSRFRDACRLIFTQATGRRRRVVFSGRPAL